MSEKTDKPAPPATNYPLPPNRLEQICKDACESTLEKVEAYDHSQTTEWNSKIINKVLRALMSESKPAGQDAPPYKFIINSTIIQHLGSGHGSAGSAAGGTSGHGGKSVSGVGRRGLHSACGAYWNAEKDGMWSYKHGTSVFDVVVVITWIGL